MPLTEFGVWTFKRAVGDGAGEAAALAEELGFGAIWLGGSPTIGDLRPFLEATETLLAGTSIVNVWRLDAAEAAREWAELERDFPGRALAGIGAGHPERDGDYRRPFSAVRDYLDEFDAIGQPPSELRYVAALAPRMTELAGSRSAGSIPYFTPVEHTRISREELGEGPVLAPELACVVDEDTERGRETARAYAAPYLGLANYRAANLRGGFEEADLEDGGSERLLDEVVPQGSPARIAAVARAHLEAGADHVALQTVGVKGVPREEWTALAAELIA